MTEVTKNVVYIARLSEYQTTSSANPKKPQLWKMLKEMEMKMSSEDIIYNTKIAFPFSQTDHELMKKY